MRSATGRTRRTLTIKVINSLLSLPDEIRELQLNSEEKNLLVTLPAASLPEPDTVDFGAVRAAREEVICSMAERMLELNGQVKTRFDNA